MQKKGHSEAVYAENFVLYQALERVEAKIAGMVDDGYTVEFSQNSHKDKLFMVSGFAKRYQIEGEIEILENAAIAIHYSKVLNLLPKRYSQNTRKVVASILLGIALLISGLQLTNRLGYWCYTQDTLRGTVPFTEVIGWEWVCYQALSDSSRWLILIAAWVLFLSGTYAINRYDPNKKENAFARQAVEGLEKRFLARLHES